MTESPSCLRFLFHLRATLSSPPSQWFFFNREKYKSRRIQEQEARLMSLSSPGSVLFTRQNRSTSKGSRRKETKIQRNVRHGLQFLFFITYSSLFHMRSIFFYSCINCNLSSISSLYYFTNFITFYVRTIPKIISELIVREFSRSKQTRQK